jgi:hypothetical protein
MSQLPSQPPSKPNSNLPKPETKAGRRTQRVLTNIWEPLDILGRSLMGDLWRTLYLSIQDAIALGTILQLPSLLSRIIIGKDFSSFDVCFQESALGVSRYACFIIIISDFCLWIVLAGRITGRFLVDICELWRSKNGSNKP